MIDHSTSAEQAPASDHPSASERRPPSERLPAADELPLPLDPGAPLPLYHQIAVALRYRIATGRLSVGSVLPPLRDAAAAWGVNYHTVRRSYGILEEMGLVERRQGSGTRVTSGATPTPSGATATSSGVTATPFGATATPSGATARRDAVIEAFVGRVAREAHDGFGISPRQLAALLAGGPGAEPGTAAARPAGAEGRGRACVVECNPHQCADLARQLRAAFDIVVEEHVLGSDRPPPPGPLIGTYFHLTEMRLAWPERWSDMHFPALEPDPALGERLRGRVEGRSRIEIPLCEREATLAEAMADDVARLLLPDGILVRPVVDRDVEETLAEHPDVPVLIAPRLWSDLDEEARRHPRAIEVAYRFRPDDVRAIAADLGWSARAGFGRPRAISAGGLRG